MCNHLAHIILPNKDKHSILTEMLHYAQVKDSYVRLLHLIRSPSMQLKVMAAGALTDIVYHTTSKDSKQGDKAAHTRWESKYACVWARGWPRRCLWRRRPRAAAADSR